MTMVKETRIVFRLNDIAGLRYRCSSCKNEVLQSIESPYPIPRHCPLCKIPWFQVEDGVNHQLVEALRNVLAQECLPLEIRLELDGEADNPEQS